MTANIISAKTIVLLLMLLVVSLFLSFKGLFLSKFALTQHSTNQTAALEQLYNIALPNTHPAPAKRLILFLVDALKYSFVLPVSPDRITPSDNCSANIFTIATTLTRTQPARSILFKSVADHPTTTSQRLKAVATGTVPVYMEIGQNLGTLRVTEDSFLYQLANNGKGVVFMGDDAWTTLHNNSLYLRTYSHDSFDIFDLEGVDMAVRTHVFSELKEAKDWTVLLAHCTGLDHAGHAYGGNNREITRKLREMNYLATQIISDMDEDTMLMLFGDHGMLANGNHGGSSEDEVSTVLFAYAKKEFGYEKLKKKGIMYEKFEECMRDVPYSKYKHPLNESENVISQIDMVPTISRLTGTPIPHNNIAMIIPKLLMQNCDSFVDCMYDLTIDYLVNAFQVYNYVNEYVKIVGDGKTIGRETVEHLYKGILSQKEAFVEQILKPRDRLARTEVLLSNNSTTLSHSQIEDLKLYMRAAIKMQTELGELIRGNADRFRLAWLEFNPLPAYASCAILAAVCVSVLAGIISETLSDLKTGSGSELSWRQIAILACTLLALFLCLPSVIGLVVAAFGVLAFVMWKHSPFRNAISLKTISSKLCTQEAGYVAIFSFFVIARIYTLFSDSLLYVEGKLTLYFKATLILVLAFFQASRNPRKLVSLPSLLLLASCVVGHYIVPTYERALAKLAVEMSSEGETQQGGVSVVVELGPVIVTKLVFMYNVYGKVFMPTWLRFCNYANEAVFLLYVTLRSVGAESAESDWHLYLPRTIYILTFSLIAYTVIKLLCTQKSCANSSSWNMISLLYNLQVVLGTPVCPLSYMLLLLDSYSISRLELGTGGERLIKGLLKYVNSVEALYVTEHIPRFTHLQLFSGFVGFQKFHLATTPVFVYLNTCGPLFLTLGISELFDPAYPTRNDRQKAKQQTIISDAINEWGTIAILWVTQFTCMNIFVTVERENLHFADYMAPKFIFDIALTVSALLFIIAKVVFLSVYYADDK